MSDSQPQTDDASDQTPVTTPNPGKLAKFFGMLGFETDSYKAWVKAGKPLPDGMVNPDDPPTQPATHVDIRNMRVLVTSVEDLSSKLDTIIDAARNDDGNLKDKVLELVDPVAELKGIAKVLKADDETP